ncbi:hypothetical protein [Kibdelosporangium philippinense]|uniref:hypothetical protein n=1 Tax=Kibdelosporangium philippinense TaxID=211113 RepID=UPI0036193E3F
MDRIAGLELAGRTADVIGGHRDRLGWHKPVTGLSIGSAPQAWLIASTAGSVAARLAGLRRRGW